MSGFYGSVPLDCIEIVGKSNEILVDFDEEGKWKRASLWLAYGIFEEFDKHQAEWWESRNGGKHLRLVLEHDMPIITRVAWSIVLGGDVLHGVFSLARGYQRLFRPSTSEKVVD